MSKTFSLVAVLSATLTCSGLAAGAEPVNLTVGYQPYDTISYSAVVIRALDLWKKYLPPGSKVTFQSALQGTIIVNAMIAGKQQIGYLGDMPAVISTTKRQAAKIDLVASTGLSPGQRCNLIMVRANAPKFKSVNDAIQWLNGKRIAVPKGSCADRFLSQVIERTKIKPAEVLNQSLEVLSSGLRVGKLDAAALWEPTASRIGNIVGQGIARYAVTGYYFHIPDSGYIAMREDLIKQRPDVVEDWLKTELAAQRFVLDPKNWDKVAEFVKSQTIGITVPEAWFSLYGAIPASAGGSPIRDTKPFVFDSDVHGQLIQIYHFLHKNKVINVDGPALGALNDSYARKVAKEAGAKLPLGVIKAQPASKAPKQ